MVHDKCRLDHLVFAELVEEEVYDIALDVTVLILDVVLVSKFLSLFSRCDLIEINAGLLFDRVDHGELSERLAQVDFLVAVDDRSISLSP